VVPVERETSALIREIQKRGAKTMALTARPIELADSTLGQLKSIGIDLSLTSVVSRDVPVQGQNPALFRRGALLVGPKNNKGLVLVQFLEQTGFLPEKIVFVDNKLKHVENVEKALKPLGISYFGRRHGAADQKIASMNKDIVEIQHRYFFGEVLSDTDAMKLLLCR
jgi:hypothetical protein